MPVIYVYPQTGVLGGASPPGWDRNPRERRAAPWRAAAFATTPPSYGSSAPSPPPHSQPTEEQGEFAARERMPFLLVSDPSFLLAEARGLPTFESHADASTGDSH